jgi:hypothetical protein
MPIVQNYGNFMSTLCPLGAQTPKAGNILKTNDQKRNFSRAKAGNILKISRLIDTMEIGNLGDKLALLVDCDVYLQLEAE